MVNIFWYWLINRNSKYSLKCALATLPTESVFQIFLEFSKCISYVKAWYTARFLWTEIIFIREFRVHCAISFYELKWYLSVHCEFIYKLVGAHRSAYTMTYLIYVNVALPISWCNTASIDTYFQMSYFKFSYHSSHTGKYHSPNRKDLFPLTHFRPLR